MSTPTLNVRATIEAEAAIEPDGFLRLNVGPTTAVIDPTARNVTVEYLNASNPSPPLTVDPDRVENNHSYSGIFIRATHDGRWGSYDIAELDRASLLRFLRSRGGHNEWAEGVVLGLLGHPIIDLSASSEDDPG